ncbi:uncharacterized protein LOC110440958 [Mizuhopecten yessoensis]|uniref:uncharacterized protein LOC110440958 n=1 Tax=Mizuhopecten yessoensis TaxID=6573 RepID=UPI000B45EE29|nr:uncharacterized protein LOC110440958 [Mizuhopecten yessoensis]
MMYPGYKKYLDSAHMSYDLYNEKVLQLMSLYGIETEAEVVTGAIQKLKKTRGYLQNEKYEIEKIIQGKMSIIRQKVRADFFEEFSEEGENNSVSADDTKKFLAKASAWYVVAYDVKSQLVNTGKRLVSFPWIMSEFLSQIKANACLATSEETADKSAKPERPELVQIGSSIVRHFDTRHEDRLATFQFLQVTFTMISDHLHRFLGPGIRVSFTGLPSLCLMDMYTRDINVCLELQQQITGKDFNTLLKNVMASYMAGYRPLTPKSFIVRIDVDPVTVTFSQNTIDIGRTNFIRRQLQRSSTYTLILTFLLDWARKYTIIGRSPNALFSEVVFTLLVLKLLSDVDSKSTEINTTHDDMNHMNVSSWLPGKITASKQLHTASLVMAVLRNFNSLLISDEKGEIRINVPDPTDDVRSQRFLVPGHLRWRKFKHLTEEILFVYQEIAKNRSVNIFFEQNIIEEGHLMMNLPLETWGSVMFAETYTARRLSEETGAEISIRRKTFRDTTGLILEAWGTREELWNVPQSLQDLNDKSSKFVTTSARDKAFIGGAYKRIFYGSTGPDQQLTFDRYTGRCQPAHKQLTLYVPFLDSSCQNDKNTALEKFKEVFRTQMELIRQDFERTYHGDLRIALTFGIFYVFYVENPQFTISEFEMAFEGNVKPQEKQLELNLPGRGGWRNRKRHGRFTKPKPRHIRGSFMPTECDKNNVSAFLGNSNFKERHGEVKYHAAFMLGNQDYGKPHEGLVILDKDLLFIELRLSDLKWMAVDVCRGYNGIPNTNKRLDVRCKLHSRRLMDMEGVQEMADTKMLLEPSTRVLLKPQPDVLYVSPEFRNRVSFVREKRVKSYHYEGPVTEYSIWQDMSIEIATVFEYSIPDSSGRFQDMVEKQEVTVIPKLPPLDTTETDWDSYAENIWELIEQLGEQFDSD